MQSYNSCLCPFCVHLIQTVTQTSAHKTSSVHVKVSPLSLHPDLAIFLPHLHCASQVQVVEICNSLLFPKDGPFCAGLILQSSTPVQKSFGLFPFAVKVAFKSQVQCSSELLPCIFFLITDAFSDRQARGNGPK